MLILMSICLLASPGECREERLSFSFGDADPMMCMIRSQEVLADWTQNHPEYRVESWRCVMRNAVPNRT